MFSFDFNTVVQPFTVIVLTAATAACAQVSRLAQERLHASRVARIADAVGRVAGEVRDQLEALPSSADAEAVKQALIADGVSHIKEVLPDTVAKVGVSEDVLGRMVSGALGQLNSTGGKGAAAIGGAVSAAIGAALPALFAAAQPAPAQPVAAQPAAASAGVADAVSAAARLVTDAVGNTGPGALVADGAALLGTVVTGLASGTATAPPAPTPAAAASAG